MFRNWRGNMLGSALHQILAGSPERVPFLQDRGIDINLQDTYGRIARGSADRLEREEVIAFSMDEKSNWRVTNQLILATNHGSYNKLLSSTIYIQAEMIPYA